MMPPPGLPPPNFSLPPPGFQPPFSSDGNMPGNQMQSSMPPGDGNQEVWVETKTAEGKVRDFAIFHVGEKFIRQML